MKNRLNQLLDENMERGHLRPQDIPDLDLYMDQIISLMAAHLSPDGQSEPLTRTMIHNYSKAGLISPVKGKKYTKEHILQILTIYCLKNTLSIAQIKRVLWGINNRTPTEDSDAEVLTACFSDYQGHYPKIQDSMRQMIQTVINETQLHDDSPAELLPFLLMLTSVADTLSSFAASIAEECFPEPPTGKRKK